jgi:hypothetical protein
MSAKDQVGVSRDFNIITSELCFYIGLYALEPYACVLMKRLNQDRLHISSPVPSVEFRHLVFHQNYALRPTGIPAMPYRFLLYKKASAR